MNNFLYYDTPPGQYQTYYGPIQAPFKAGKEIFTQLPKNVAIIRTLAAISFTSLLALKLSTTVFCWPVVIAGIAFAGRTIYSHLLSKDPLMETFYKIMGGKNKFEALPQIKLTQAPNEKICEAIRNIKWDQLNHPIAITRTLDGRNVIIIKGLTRYPQNQGFSSNSPTKGVLAFVERTCPGDVPRVSNLPEFVDSIMHAIFAPHEGNTLGRWLYSSSKYDNGYHNNYYGRVYSSISGDMANELFAQLANKLPKNG